MLQAELFLSGGLNKPFDLSKCCCGRVDAEKKVNGMMSFCFNYSAAEQLAEAVRKYSHLYNCRKCNKLCTGMEVWRPPARRN